MGGHTIRKAIRLLTALAAMLMAAQVTATETTRIAANDDDRRSLPANQCLFPAETSSLFDSYESWFGLPAGAEAETTQRDQFRFAAWQPDIDSPAHWSHYREVDLYRLAAADQEPIMPNGSSPAPDLYASPDTVPETPSYGRMFFKGWALITSVELVLLVVTAMLPKSWTGWSSTFVRDGWENMKEAYTMPPVWDTDHWFHNYIGHPYGGSVYYNTVRCQGANPAQSFLFSTALSLQWEYIFEAVAERPSIQDLLITPITGSILGEFVHHLTISLKRHGTNFLEKVIITILNPGSAIFNGYS